MIEVAGGVPEGHVEHERVNDDASGYVTVEVPRRTALKERLELAARAWKIHDEFQIKPTDRQVADACEVIEKASARLLKALRLAPESYGPHEFVDRVPNALRFGVLQAWAAKEAADLGGLPKYAGASLLDEAIRSVDRLRRWSGAAKRRQRAKADMKERPPHAGDEALDRLIGELAGIWMEVFERPIATSVDSVNGKPGGPMVRFASAALRPLLGDRTPSDFAIRARIRKLQA